MAKPRHFRLFSGMNRKQWQSVIAAHGRTARQDFSDYWKGLNGGGENSTLEAGLDAMRESCLSYRSADPGFPKNMETWAGDRDLDLDKDEVKAEKSITRELRDARTKGRATFESINKRVAL